MKQLMIALFSLILMITSTTPKSAYIKGKVTDAKTKKAIEFATILLHSPSSQFQVQTDLNGNYVLGPVEEGYYRISVQLLGYQEFIKDSIYLKPNATVTLNLSLNKLNEKKKELIIKGLTLAPPMQQAPQEINSTHYYVDDIKTNQFESYDKNIYESETDVSSNYNTEDYDAIVENNWKQALNDPLSTFSIDVDKASYSNMRRYLQNGSLPPAGAVRIEEMINYFKYNYSQPKDNHPFSLTTELADCPWNESHKILLIGLQGKELDKKDLPASNLVFLIDVSGSMNSYNKLPLVKQSLNMLVDQLRKEDKVSLVVYAGAAGVVLAPTSGSEKEKIRAAINKLEAGGSTAGGEGIMLAYKTAKDAFIKEGNNRIILATDGDFNVGVSSDAALVKMVEEKRKEGVYLTVLGFGMGNYKDNKMEKLADKGNGNYAYIDQIMEAKKVFINEFAGTLFTIAKDVKLQLEWNPQQVKGYRLIGYENRLLNKEDFNDDKKDAGDMGAGHTVTALYEIIPASSDEVIPGVDSLKYQHVKIETSAKEELLTIKMRYKKPDSEVSNLMIHPQKISTTQFEKASENLRWACSVTAFGHLLRDSQYKGNINYSQVIQWAKNAKGTDEEGYRSEFIKLVELAKIYDKRESKKE